VTVLLLRICIERNLKSGKTDMRQPVGNEESCVAESNGFVPPAPDRCEHRADPNACDIHRQIEAGRNWTVRIRRLMKCGARGNRKGSPTFFAIFNNVAVIWSAVSASPACKVSTESEY
jgi:hypothetical protein